MIFILSAADPEASPAVPEVPSVAVYVRLDRSCTDDGDINGDCLINNLDMGILLSAWSLPTEDPGPGCGGAVCCGADLDSDGYVNTLDFGILLSNWTIQDEEMPGIELCPGASCDPAGSCGEEQQMMAGGGSSSSSAESTPAFDAELIQWLLSASFEDLWAWWIETFGGE